MCIYSNLYLISWETMTIRPLACRMESAMAGQGRLVSILTG